ncbi:MAG: hypothetical protein NTZ74_16505, partial [Chloroflexi bacterium]|nr:hypothetical protein [Chloroflexota bacterium]
ISTPFYVLHNMQYNYITKKTEKQVLFCCQGRFIDLSDYSKIDAFILLGLDLGLDLGLMFVYNK